MTHPNQQYSNHEVREPDLPSVEIAFAEAFERGDSLASWIHRYPQYAIELTDLAIELEPFTEDEEVSDAEIEYARGALHQAARQVLGTPPHAPNPGAIARARELGMEVTGVARGLRLSPDVLFQIDRGLVDLGTLPKRLLRQISAVLKLPLEALPDGLVCSHASPASFYTRDKPRPVSPIPFAEALRDAEDLQATDRDMWLAVAREEGLSS